MPYTQALEGKLAWLAACTLGWTIMIGHVSLSPADFLCVTTAKYDFLDRALTQIDVTSPSKSGTWASDAQSCYPSASAMLVMFI